MLIPVCPASTNITPVTNSEAEDHYLKIHSIFLIKNSCIYLFVYVCGCLHASVCGGQKITHWKSVFSFHFMCLRGGTKVARLVGKSLYLLRNLAHLNYVSPDPRNSPNFPLLF